MADEQLTFPIEEIPDTDSVFMRAHRNLLRDGVLTPGVFRAQGSGMSVDWSRYSSQEETRQRARNPIDNAVVAMVAGEIRDVTELPVNHSPQPDNRSHSDVFLPTADEDLTEARLKLRRIAKVVIPLAN